jgi:hypothetical protein
VAAAQTVESMLKNLNDYDLTSNFFLHQQQTASQPHQQQLDQFNLNQLLASGQRLLGTSLNKYEPKDKDLTSNQPDRELVRQQRNTLYMKLGIDVDGAAKLDTRHLFSDEDLLGSVAQPDETSSSSTSSVSSKRREIDSAESNLDEQSSSKKVKLEPEMVKKEPLQGEF